MEVSEGLQNCCPDSIKYEKTDKSGDEVGVGSQLQLLGM